MISLRARFMMGSILSLTSAVVSADTTRSTSDDVLRETQVAYIAEHADGGNERIVVKYQALLYHKVWQSGSAAKPLKGKMTDDRTCHYETKARVYRTAYILSLSGIQAPVEQYQEVYDASKYVKRGPDNAFEALTRHVTCEDVDLFKDRIQGARKELIDNFDLLVAQDGDKARTRLAAMLSASRLVKDGDGKLAKDGAQ